METLPKAIIYDDSCPMCQLYTKGFVNMGLMKQENRMQFSCVDAEVMERMDLDRARHEIPLVDLEGGETIYGMDSLFYILGYRWPVFKPLFQNKIFRACIYQLYQVITFNRRVIAGNKAPKTGFDCAPDFNLKYRFIYILIAILMTAAIVIPFGMREVVQANMGLMASSIFMATLAIGSAFYGLFRKNRVTFLGHWITVVLIGALSMLPLIWVANFLPMMETTLLTFGLGLSLGMMIWQLVRRV